MYWTFQYQYEHTALTIVMDQLAEYPKYDAPR